MIFTGNLNVVWRSLSSVLREESGQKYGVVVPWLEEVIGGWWLHLPGTGASGAWGVSMSCGVGGGGCLETVPSPAQPSPATTSWLHPTAAGPGHTGLYCRPGPPRSLLQACHKTLTSSKTIDLGWLFSSSVWTMSHVNIKAFVLSIKLPRSNINIRICCTSWVCEAIINHAVCCRKVRGSSLSHWILSTSSQRVS